jgi:hypothetical protein
MLHRDYVMLIEGCSIRTATFCLMLAVHKKLSNPLCIYKNDPLRVIQTYYLYMQSVHVGILAPIHFFSRAV